MKKFLYNSSILRSAVYGYVAAFVYFVSGILSHIVISRVCGPSVLGEYFFIVTLNTVVTNFASLGVGFSHTTFLAKKEHTLSQMNFVSIFFSFFFGITSIVLFCCVKKIFSDCFAMPHLKFIWLAFAVLPFTIYIRYWNSMMVGIDRIPLLSKVISLTSLLWNFLTVLTVVLKAGLEMLLSVWVVYLIVSVMIMMVLMFRYSGIPRYIPGLLGKAFMFGFKGNIGEIATELWKRMDVFLLCHFCGIECVGTYSVAVTIIEKFNQITAPIRIAITPEISGGSKGNSSRLTAKATRQIMYFTAVSIIIIIILAGEFIRIFYGSLYVTSVLPLRLLAMGAIGISVASVLSIFFIGQLKKPGLLSILAWINVILNLVLCLIFVPRLALTGAALSTSITCLLGGAILVIFYWKITGNSLKEIVFLQGEDIQTVLKVLYKLRIFNLQNK